MASNKYVTVKFMREVTECFRSKTVRDVMMALVTAVEYKEAGDGRKLIELDDEYAKQENKQLVELGTITQPGTYFLYQGDVYEFRLRTDRYIRCNLVMSQNDKFQWVANTPQPKRRLEEKARVQIVTIGPR